LPLLIVAAFGAFKLYMSGKRCSPVYLVAAGWTASALVSAVMVGNIYIHYFAPVVPGLAILASPAFVQSRLGAMLASFAILSGLLFFNPAHHHQISAMSRSGFAGVVKLATPFVGSQRDCLYVFDGPTALYRETHSCLPGRVVYPDHLNNAQEASALGVDTAAEVARILANRPSVIVTASKPVVPTYNAATAALVNRAVARDYVRMGTFRYFPRRLIVHVRRDLLYRATARRREGLSGGS
jgi:hypothetical protein